MPAKPSQAPVERGQQVLDMGEQLIGMVGRRNWRECSSWLTAELLKAEQRGRELERVAVVDSLRGILDPEALRFIELGCHVLPKPGDET